MTETVDLKAYWEQVSRFSVYPVDKRADGYALGLLAEAGEVCGVVDKWLRGQYDEAEMKRRLVDELGDVCWYAVALTVYRYRSEVLSDVLLHRWISYQEVPNSVWVLNANVVDMSRTLLTDDYLDELEVVFASIEMLCLHLDTTLQAVLDANVAKLTGRHG